MSLSLPPSYAVLCLAQGAIALIPGRTRRFPRLGAVALLAPVAGLVGGVLLVRGVGEGAGALAASATVVAPLGTALAGLLLGWRRWWWCAPAALALYLVAWRAHGLVAQAAGIALIAGACAAGAAIVRACGSDRAIAAGLVLLVAVDVVLVLGVNDVAPATRTLHAVVPPSATFPGAGSRPLPALQDATFGGALMGWLDILAPAILALLMTRRPVRRALAAVATTAAALAWGLLLMVRAEIPATVPVLAGLAVWWVARRHAAAREARAAAPCEPARP